MNTDVNGLYEFSRDEYWPLKYSVESELRKKLALEKYFLLTIDLPQR